MSVQKYVLGWLLYHLQCQHYNTGVISAQNTGKMDIYNIEYYQWIIYFHYHYHYLSKSQFRSYLNAGLFSRRYLIIMYLLSTADIFYIPGPFGHAAAEELCAWMMVEEVVVTTVEGMERGRAVVKRTLPTGVVRQMSSRTWLWEPSGHFPLCLSLPSSPLSLQIKWFQRYI